MTWLSNVIRLVVIALAAFGTSELLGPRVPVAQSDRPPSATAYIGSRWAPVSLVVYTRYSCGFCTDFASMTDTLLARYPEHLRVIVRNVPSTAGSSEARFAIAAECAADQDAFPRYHRAAFEDA